MGIYFTHIYFLIPFFPHSIFYIMYSFLLLSLILLLIGIENVYGHPKFAGNGGIMMGKQNNCPYHSMKHKINEKQNVEKDLLRMKLKEEEEEEEEEEEDNQLEKK